MFGRRHVRVPEAAPRNQGGSLPPAVFIFGQQSAIPPEFPIGMTVVPPLKRYDESRFVDPIPDSLQCAICLELVVDAQECKHCEQLNCGSCWRMIQNNKCPNCREISNLKPMNRHLRNSLYDTLKLKCCNAPACTQLCTLASVNRHENECYFGEVKCSLCFESKLRGNIANHNLLECSERMVECQHCHLNLKFKNLDQHLLVCDLVPFPCGYCNASINKRSSYEHGSQCPEQVVSCNLENSSGLALSKGFFFKYCGDRVLRKLLVSHQCNDCKYRIVVCEYCGENVQHFAKPYHEKYNCLNFVHICIKCAAIYTRALGNHSDICPKENIRCKWYDCVVCKTRDSIVQHESQCDLRLITCNYCQMVLKFCNLSHHLNECVDYPLTCSFCHTEKIERKNLKAHYDVCLKVEINCPVGNCTHKCLRGNLQDHFSDPMFSVLHIEELMQLLKVEKEKNLLNNT